MREVGGEETSIHRLSFDSGRDMLCFKTLDVVTLPHSPCSMLRAREEGGRVLVMRAYGRSATFDLRWLGRKGKGLESG